jgi:hypothetical protein
MNTSWFGINSPITGNSIYLSLGSVVFSSVLTLILGSLSLVFKVPSPPTFGTSSLSLSGESRIFLS